MILLYTLPEKFSGQKDLNKEDMNILDATSIVKRY